jgi:hypothetical protein
MLCQRNTSSVRVPNLESGGWVASRLRTHNRKAGLVATEWQALPVSVTTRGVSRYTSRSDSQQLTFGSKFRY